MSTPTTKRAPVPRLAVTKTDAAAALGVSVQFFEEHVVHELAIAHVGRRRLIPMKELERWLDEHCDMATAKLWKLR